MKEHATERLIEASPEAVWAALTDAAAYQDWNPEIVAIEGRLAQDERITAHVRLGSGVVRKVGLRVTHLDPPRAMEWTARVPLGLFTGKRTFTVAPSGDGRSFFRLHLAMSGPMLPMILKSVGDRQPEVESFADALKRRVERSR